MLLSVDRIREPASLASADTGRRAAARQGMAVPRSAPWGRVTKPAVASVSEPIALQGDRCLICAGLPDTLNICINVTVMSRQGLTVRLFTESSRRTVEGKSEMLFCSTRIILSV